MPPDLLSQVVIALVPLLLLAAGQGLVATGGGVDLAAPGVVMAATAAGAWVLAATAGSLGAAAAAMLLTGLAIGIVIGMAVSLLPLPAWLVTLAGLGVLCGLGTELPAAPVPDVPPGVADGAGPLPAWTGLALLASLTVHLLREKLVFGPWLRAIGCDRESARMAGVPVHGVTVAAHALNGVCAGLAAVFVASHPASSDPPSPWWLVDILGAVAVSGLRGPVGKGSVPGVLLGAVFLVGLGSLLSRAGAPHGLVVALKSLVVLSLLAFTARAARYH